MRENSPTVAVDNVEPSTDLLVDDGFKCVGGETEGSIRPPDLWPPCPQHEVGTEAVRVSTSRDRASQPSVLAAEERSGVRTEGFIPWAGHIQRQFAQGKSSLIGLAITVSAAKSKLPYGEWSRLWNSGLVPFGKRRAERLALVGEGLGWLDAIDRTHLPSALRALYCLAQLDRTGLRLLLADGTIHPRLSERAAKELLARLRGRPSQTEEPRIRNRLNRFASFIRKAARAWQPQEREYVTAELHDLLEMIEEQSVSTLLPTALAPSDRPKPCFRGSISIMPSVCAETIQSS